MEAMPTLLHEELSALRAAPPPFLAHVDDPHAGTGGAQVVHADIEGPDDTVYMGQLFRVCLTVPSDYPAHAPQVRFCTPIAHYQLNEAGFPDPIFYDNANLKWGPGSSSGGSSGGNGLARVLRQCHSMLHTPLHDAPPADAEILEVWRDHDPTCRCSRFPIPFEELEALPEEARAQHLEAFRQRFLEDVRAQARHSHEAHHLSRIRCIVAYEPLRLHRPLFDAGAGWRDEWFDERFLAAVRGGSKAALAAITSEDMPRVISFPMFTPEFCRMLVEEVHHFERSDVPKHRPNSMNNYGFILNHMGMHDMMTLLMEQYVRPFAAAFYGEYHGDTVDHHHTFVVQYKEGADLNLDMHVDDSEVTLNVNIFDGFRGAGLTFCGMFGTAAHRKEGMKYTHQLGRAVMHAGRHRHGADSLDAGERLNLIMWCRSSEHRKPYMRPPHGPPAPEDGPPDPVCLSRTHDADYHTWMPSARACECSHHHHGDHQHGHDHHHHHGDHQHHGDAHAHDHDHGKE